ncbi:CapA family protein [Sphingobacterium sp. HJSM2_6]|uniref:CapA family protein n=1 Tax=Sphingobacterium sp. HJSM2_6 TaxID=3366264 RepID=UPI003BD3C0B2
MSTKNKHKFIFVGDAVLSSKPVLSAELKSLFDSADVLSCNFEAPLTGYGSPIQKTGPLVSQSVDAPRLLLDMGFNLFSLANNHIYDYGDLGLQNTIAAFPKEMIIGVGGEDLAYAAQIRVLDDISYGFMAFGENGYGALNGDRDFGHAWVNAEQTEQAISYWKSKVDVLIIQVHAGVELLDVPIPEWRSRYRALLHAGADVIVGHHPHVVQAVETYEGKLICYSLGNFYFDYPSNHPQWNTGGLLTLEFDHKNLVHHQVQLLNKKAEQVSLMEREQSDVELHRLQEKLMSADYTEYVNQFAIKEWELHHAAYYAKPFNGLARYQFKSLLKQVKRTVFNRKIDYNMLWHNLFIESNKWLVERAIRLKIKK